MLYIAYAVRAAPPGRRRAIAVRMTAAYERRLSLIICCCWRHLCLSCGAISGRWLCDRRGMDERGKTALACRRCGSCVGCRCACCFHVLFLHRRGRRVWCRAVQGGKGRVCGLRQTSRRWRRRVACPLWWRTGRLATARTCRRRGEREREERKREKKRKKARATCFLHTYYNAQMSLCGGKRGSMCGRHRARHISHWASRLENRPNVCWEERRRRQNK